LNHFTQALFSLLFSVLLFGGASAFPGETVVSCSTDFPTTSYVIEEDSDGFLFHIVYHNGVDYIPIHNGDVVAADLPNLIKRAERLKKMGTHATFRFKKEKCSSEGLYWRCYQGKPVEVGSSDVLLAGFAMGRLESNYNGFKWVSTETFLFLDFKEENLTLTQSYPEGSCRSR